MSVLKPPAVVSRTEWGAMVPVTRIPSLGKAVRIVLHHSFLPTAKQYKGSATIRGIQKYHIEDKRWSDIGYHYLVGPDGIIYEGRHADRLGAHCGGTLPKGSTRHFGNAGSIGICMIGDYDKEDLNQKMVNAVITLILWIQEQHGITHKEIFGHCEASDPPPKSCPGKKAMQELLGKIRCPA